MGRRKRPLWGLQVCILGMHVKGDEEEVESEEVESEEIEK